MGFMDRDKVVADNIAKAEKELAEVTATERPEQVAPASKPEDKPEVKTSPADDVPAIVDGVNWKDRYGNLQRYIEKTLKPKQQADIEALQSQINGLTKQIREMISKASPSNLPETAEEVEKLKKENPSAYAAIMKVATDVAESLVSDRLAEMENDVQEIKRARKETAEEAAFVELQRRFPEIDLLALEEDPQFKAWIVKKSQRTQDAIFKNKSDVDAAADVLLLYKYEVLSQVKKPDTAPKGNKPGSELVDVKSGQPQITANPQMGWDFVESEIAEMDVKNPRWLEQNLEAIDKAQRAGRILLDITDPVGSGRRMAALGVA